MWEDIRYKRPFYKRPWFYVPLLVLGIVGVLGGVFLLVEKSKWEQKARALDYSQLEVMDSASLIYDRDGQVLSRIFTENRDQVPLDQIAPEMKAMVMAAEDTRFYEHKGVDWRGVARAVVRNWQAGRTVQGASTLTQQLARNSFPVDLPPSDRTRERKLLEMFVALEIENRYDHNKDKILELYLNRVFFGNGLYGVESAAKAYFGKSAKALNLSECATLAGMLRSPTKLSPWKNREKCMEERDRVLRRAVEEKIITQETFDATLKEDLVVKNRKPISQESYAAELVVQQVEKLVGKDAASGDGYRIYTTIDGELQKQAEAAMRERLEAIEAREGYEHPKESDYAAQFKARQKTPVIGANGEVVPMASPDYLQGSVVVLDNATGGILAMTGGRDFHHSEYNRALMSRRPAGTAFTPFVFAAAFEKGAFPGTVVQDTVMNNQQVMIGGTQGILGEWGVERGDNKYEGNISARQALVQSKNAATVRLGSKYGVKAVNDLAARAGIESELRQFPATFLGSSEVTLMELTLAYTIFPNGGWRPDRPFIIERIEDKAGNIVFKAKPETSRVIRPTTAYEVHSCLAEVLERGTADKAYTTHGLKKSDLGGKTGTAYNFTDTWFMGYSGAVTCGVWVGFDKPRPIYRGAFSNETALPLWAQIMKSTSARYRGVDIIEPAGLTKCEICTASGLAATDRCMETIQNAATGENFNRRTTYFEMAASDQVPKLPCDVHSGVAPGNNPSVRALPASQFQRAVAVVDLTAFTPVAMKAPTVIGESDPYRATQAIKDAQELKKFDGQAAPINSERTIQAPTATPGPAQANTPVRPLPVQPSNSAIKESPLEVEPPKPIQF